MTDDLESVERRADALVQSHEELLEKLISMRSKHRLTQADVAERMGVSQPTVAAFERYDANPTLATIRRYALAVGARIDHSIIDDCIQHSPEAREDGVVMAVQMVNAGVYWQPAVGAPWASPNRRKSRV